MSSLFIILLFACASIANADGIVPGSISPDRTRSILYITAPESPPHAPPSFYVVEMPSRRRLSDNLYPRPSQLLSQTEDQARRNNRNQNTALLLDMFGYHTEAILRKESGDGAFNYQIYWSDDLRTVILDGGMHKFSHTIEIKLKARKYVRQ